MVKKKYQSVSDLLKSLTVLYAEDDSDIRRLILPHLEPRVKRVVVAENGQEGFDLFHEHRPDMVITDILMPDINGLSMARAIRVEDEEIPIIVTTAHSDESFFIQSIDLGIDRYVLKPTKPKVLMAAVEKCAYYLQRQREEESANHYIRFLLDAQPSLLMVVTDGELEYLNRAFLRFLGFPTMIAFQMAHPEIGDLLVTRQGTPFSQMNRGDWIDTLLSDPKAHSIIYLRPPGADEGELTPYSVTFNTLPEQDKHLFSFADVTHIEDEKRRLEQHAFTDALTGTCNRARLQSLLNVEMQRANRHHIPLSIILCDIDHFKRVNDTHGHQVGDDVLKAVSGLMSQNVRAEDIVARWGGEEFMIVSPQNDLNHTRMLAEKIRTLIADTPFAVVGRLTCSFGVAQLADKDSIRTLTERADRALYQAKSSGRNRVEVMR